MCEKTIVNPTWTRVLLIAVVWSVGFVFFFAYAVDFLFAVIGPLLKAMKVCLGVRDFYGIGSIVSIIIGTGMAFAFCFRSTTF